jgi:nucleotide-binding universal stress UspA family protein
MKILVGVDDSPHAQLAVETLCTMGWPKGTRVIVASVVRPMVGAYAETYVPAIPYVEQVTAEMRKFHQETAATAEQKLRSAGFDTEAKVLEGDPRIALGELARAENADLLVLGSHGRSGIAKLVLGSVAAHLVTHAPCSVLVVKMREKA